MSSLGSLDGTVPAPAWLPPTPAARAPATFDRPGIPAEPLVAVALPAAPALSGLERVPALSAALAPPRGRAALPAVAIAASIIGMGRADIDSVCVGMAAVGGGAPVPSVQLSANKVALPSIAQT